MMVSDSESLPFSLLTRHGDFIGASYTTEKGLGGTAQDLSWLVPQASALKEYGASWHVTQVLVI